VKKRKWPLPGLAPQRNELLALKGKLDQGEWAELLGVPVRTYGRYERGQREAPETVMRLARLGVARLRRMKRGA